MCYVLVTLLQSASRKREEKYLRIQLEQQRKAYEDMKRQMEILQSAQSDAPGEGRIIKGSSGYADFPAETSDVANGNISSPTSPPGNQLVALMSPISSSDDSSKPLLSPPVDGKSNGGHMINASQDEGREERKKSSDDITATPYLVRMRLGRGGREPFMYVHIATSCKSTQEYTGNTWL